MQVHTVHDLLAFWCSPGLYPTALCFLPPLHRRGQCTHGSPSPPSPSPLGLVWGPTRCNAASTHQEFSASSTEKRLEHKWTNSTAVLNVLQCVQQMTFCIFFSLTFTENQRSNKNLKGIRIPIKNVPLFIPLGKFNCSRRYKSWGGLVAKLRDGWLGRGMGG